MIACDDDVDGKLVYMKEEMGWTRILSCFQHNTHLVATSYVFGPSQFDPQVDIDP